jgi:hypothetical protein
VIAPSGETELVIPDGNLDWVFRVPPGDGSPLDLREREDAGRLAATLAEADLTELTAS